MHAAAHMCCLQHLSHAVCIDLLPARTDLVHSLDVVCCCMLCASVQGSYPGTLFRFPLRSDATAATSNIKGQPTSRQQALQLLQSLTDVLPQALLFLKSLQEIEVYVVGDAGTPPQAATVVPGTAGQQDKFAEFNAGGGEPQLLFKASLKPLDGMWRGLGWDCPCACCCLRLFKVAGTP